MYEYIDKHIEDLKKNIKAYFHNSRLSIMKYDSLNVGMVNDEVDKLFDKIEKQGKSLVENEIKQLGFSNKEYSTDKIFDSYNPTLMYVYKNEMERKRARHKEGILSLLKSGEDTNKFSKDVILASMLSVAYLRNEKALTNNIIRQIEETAVDTERDIFIDEGIKEGVEYVRWVTEGDDRVCSECEELDGKVFPIDEVPPRFHSGCRCELEYVSAEEYEA